MIHHLGKVLFGLLAVGIIISVIALAYINNTLEKELIFTEDIYTIHPGDSMRKVSRMLYEKNIMADPYSFALLGMFEGTATQIKSGDYQLVNGMSARQLLDLFVRGDVVTYKVSLVEGWTFGQFREKIASIKELTHITNEWSDEKIMQAISAKNIHHEGYFFPDTYVFRATDSDLDVLRQAYVAMQDRLNEIWENRDTDSPLKDKYELLILASIIEKETGKSSERPIIGGVFTNRLNKRMLLQTDPTIIYGLGDKFDGNLTRKQLDDADNLYNTYIHSGLPPTPIAMPGLASLKAAANPEKTDKYYFVAKGDGSHKFSKTYKQHRRAVVEYQLKRKRGS